MTARALTLWQPWASLVALGFKRIETRGWSTGYRGPLVIHAAARVAGRLGARWTIGEFEVERVPAGYMLRGPIAWPYLLPLGAVVARVDLTDVVPIHAADDRLAEAWQPHVAPTHNTGRLWHWLGPSSTENPSTGRPPWRYTDITAEEPYGDYTPGRFAWVCDGVVPIRRPIPCRGRQGLWRLPDDVAARLPDLSAPPLQERA
jgi:hypothetical protein